RAMNMAPFIFWNLAFYTIIRTQLERGSAYSMTEGGKSYFLVTGVFLVKGKEWWYNDGKNTIDANQSGS
ncbi:hypothetical protein ABND25_15275, partial [Paenibacillus larvae]